MSNNPLAASIHRGESSAAGYDAYNRGTYTDAHGHQRMHPLGADVSVSQLTIREVQKLQALPGNHADRLFAVGAYQMIPKTLNEAVEKLRLDIEQKFSPEIQEHIFSNYLIIDKRPAVHAYITGAAGSSLSHAQTALAAEWASLGDPGHNGASRYPPPNHASISLAQTAAALHQMRAGYQEDIAKGLSPQQAWKAVTAFEGPRLPHVDYNAAVGHVTMASARQPGVLEFGASWTRGGEARRDADSRSSDADEASIRRAPAEAAWSRVRETRDKPATPTDKAPVHREWLAPRTAPAGASPDTDTAGAVTPARGQTPSTLEIGWNRAGLPAPDGRGQAPLLDAAGIVRAQADASSHRARQGERSVTPGGRSPEGARQAVTAGHDGQAQDHRPQAQQVVRSQMALGAQAGLLQRGDRGFAVRRLQIELNERIRAEHGHTLHVDGRFGVATERAVRHFQRERSLVADGIVGTHTRHALSEQAHPHVRQQPEQGHALASVGSTHEMFEHLHTAIATGNRRGITEVAQAHGRTDAGRAWLQQGQTDRQQPAAQSPQQQVLSRAILQP